jgi:DNA-binding transcriptional MerR regulator
MEHIPLRSGAGMKPQNHGCTLSQLSERSGVRLRTLQFWTSNGVLQADTATNLKGTGTHRQWPQIEVEIAAVLGKLERYGLTVGTLHSIASEIRGWKHTAENYDLKSAEQVRRFVNEHLFRYQMRDGRHKKPKEVAEVLGLPTIPTGENKIDLGTEAGLEEKSRLLSWFHWQDARNQTEDIFMRLAISSEGAWMFDFWSGDYATPLNWGPGDTYIVIKLSSILKAT